MRRLFARLWRDRGGAAAVEMALVLPAFVLLATGSVGVTTFAFSVASLNFAVQDAARCAAVKTTVCTNSSTVSTYGQSRYVGLPISPSFTYSTSPCAHTVTATGTLSFNIIPQLSNIPVRATACYP